MTNNHSNAALPSELNLGGICCVEEADELYQRREALRERGSHGATYAICCRHHQYSRGICVRKWIYLFIVLNTCAALPLCQPLSIH